MFMPDSVPLRHYFREISGLGQRETIRGQYSRAAIAERKSLNALMREIRATLDELDSELIA
jgi:hypothetical protein